MPLRSLIRGAVFWTVLRLLWYLGEVSGSRGFGLGHAPWMAGLFAGAVVAMALAETLARLLPRRGALLLGGTMLTVTAVLPASLAGWVRVSGHPIADTGITAALALLAPMLVMRGSLSLALAMIGALAAELITGFWAIPGPGWTLSLGTLTLAWLMAEWPAPSTLDDSRRRWQVAFALPWAGALGWMVVIVRPFYLQYGTATAPNIGVIAATSLAGLWVGVLLGSSLRDSLRGWLGILVCCVCLPAAWYALGNGLQFLGSPNGAAPSYLDPFVEEGASPWVRAWLLLGVPSVAFGLGMPSLGRSLSLATAFGAAGLWLGTGVAEQRCFETLRGGDPLPLFPVAEELMNNRYVTQVSDRFLDKAGVLSVLRARSGVDQQELVHWHGERWERGQEWEPLESAEVFLPSQLSQGKGLQVVGFPTMQHELAVPSVAIDWFNPLPAVDERGKPTRSPMELVFDGSSSTSGALVFLSSGFRPAGYSLWGTADSLARLADHCLPSRGLWVWCDPRGLTGAGVRSLLATWAEACPEARLWVLMQGYAGPLLGLEVSAPTETDVEAVAEGVPVILRGKVGELVRDGAGVASTLARPVMEYEARPRSTVYLHPSGETLDALRETLVMDAEGALDHYWRGMAAHARVQVERFYVPDMWDHVVIPQAELDEYLEGMRAESGSEPLAKHVAEVAEILLLKKEYGMVLPFLEIAVEQHPHLASLHQLLGRTYREVLEPGLAVACLEEAMARDPESHEIRVELAGVYSETGDVESAVELLEEVWSETSELVPGKGLAMSYLELGRFADARRLLEHLHERVPADLEIKEALDRATQAVNEEAGAGL